MQLKYPQLEPSRSHAQSDIHALIRIHFFFEFYFFVFVCILVVDGVEVEQVAKSFSAPMMRQPLVRGFASVFR